MPPEACETCDAAFHGTAGSHSVGVVQICPRDERWSMCEGCFQLEQGYARADGVIH